ncbi:MAG: ATP-binding cassette domain-containing protein [Deltaproteobacteria bacterium]|nr:ATP-binding cassette domain-containing protein [Deltaproteobacteria bacterium]
MISIRNIHKRFGAQIVLNGINLDIEPGKTTTIVGPSGVGKSVLLKLIMGILEPDNGEILIFGKNITKARSERQRNRIRRSLGVLFQSAALFDSLTVYDNVAFPLIERGGHSRRDIHNRVLFMLEALSLESYAYNYPEEISMGIRKRVGMARSLITEPKVLLFDEPNTGLDPLVGQEVYDLIISCRQKWGFTGVVISHEIPEVFQVSDRVVMLLNGNIIEEGSPEDLMNTQNVAVRQFLEGRVDGPIKIQ